MVESIELLTPAQVCKSLKVSQSTFFRLVSRNAFSVVRIGKCLRVKATALADYLKKMES